MAYASGGEYMAIRKAKLLGELDRLEKKSNIFKGKSFYFNGYLGEEASYLDMQQLVTQNGGVVAHYLSAKVDFVIATSMSASKWNGVGKGQKVVLPSFVHESIGVGVVLDFRKCCLVDEQALLGQRRLDDVFALKPAAADAAVQDAAIEEEEEQDELEEYEGNLRKPRPDLDYTSPHIQDLIATNPSFIEKYFASSRLHHLSTWKTELINQTSKTMTELGKKGRKGTAAHPRIIMHVDMDCFFVSVAQRFLDASLKNKPAVVAHSTSSNSSTSFTSTSEIASCNYAARKLGIKNGSYLGGAKAVCPHLVVLPYDYQAIQECTAELYKVLVEKSVYVQAVSCDEAMIDITDFVWNQNISLADLEERCIDHAEEIREAVFKATKGCCASIGVGFNPLLARIATYSAKPDGVFVITPDNLDDCMYDLALAKIPGIGWHTLEKFKNINAFTCGGAQELDLEELQSLLGSKTGEYVHDACRGVDDTVLTNKVRTTVSAEVNWGVRFQYQEQVRDFAQRLARYLFQSRVANNSSLLYTHLTVKAKKRDYVGEPSKFLGCGHCVDFSKSYVSSIPYTSANQIFTDAYRLLVEMQIPATEVRGVGFHLKPKANVLENGQRVLDFASLRTSNTAKKPGEVKYLSPFKKPIDKKTLMENFFSPVKKKKSGVLNGQKSRDDAAYSEFKEMYGINPSQVDEDVLSEMPPDVLHQLGKTGFTYTKNSKTAASSRPPPFQLGQNGKAALDVDVDLTKELDDSDMLPTFSQFDLQIFDALPLDIQREQKAIAMSNKQKRKQELALAEKKNHQRVVGENVSARPKRLVPCLAEESDPAVIVENIKEWIESASTTPCLEQDIYHITAYLKALVKDLQLERCTQILRYLLLQVQGDRKGKSLETEWSNAILGARKSVDDLLLEMYGSRLDESFLFPRKFVL